MKMTASLRNNYFSTAIVAALLFCLTACQHTSTTSANSDFSSIADPRERWQAYGLRSYTIEQEHLCFCRPAFGFVKLVIENGQIIRGIHTTDAQSLTASELKRFRTVDELFEWIDQRKALNPHRLEIDYDAQYGYPRRINYEYSEFVEDDIVTFVLQDLQRF